jgi:drug/metabolite transporter (DMT)-like permease
MGVILAAVAGIGFGLFQSVNRLALRRVNVYEGTLVHMLLGTLVLMGLIAANGELEHVDGSTVGVVWFALAGIVNFGLANMLLGMSQKRIGAVRTGPLLAATPFFGTVIAATVLHELPSVPALVGMVVIVGGVFLATSPRFRRGSGGSPDFLPPASWMARLIGLGPPLCFAASPPLIREAVEALPSPLLGVTVGMATSVVLFFLVGIPGGRLALSRGTWTPRMLALEALTGALVGFSAWALWEAFSLAPVGIVLSLSLLQVPTVMLVAPVIAGRGGEDSSTAIWLGALLVLGGALVLILL